MSVGVIIQWVIGLLFDLLKQKTNDSFDQALTVIQPFIDEMFSEARAKNIGQLTPEFRAPYEARIIRAIRDLGL